MKIEYILLGVIATVFLIDFLRKKNKNTKEVSVRKDQSKRSFLSKNLIALISIVLISSFFGFYNFYLAPKKIIANISSSTDELKKLSIENDERSSILLSEISNNYKILDNKLFVYQDYEHEKALFSILRKFYDYNSVYSYFPTSLDYFTNKICKLNTNNIDSLALLKSVNLSLLTDYGKKVILNFEPLEREIIIIDLIKIFFENKACEKSFFLTEVKDTISKINFENSLNVFADKYENKDFLEKIKVLADPTQVNILSYLGIKNKNVDLMNCQNQFLGTPYVSRLKKNYSKREQELLKCRNIWEDIEDLNEENIQRLEFLYSSLMTFNILSKVPFIDTATKELLFYILTVYIESEFPSNISGKLLVEYFKKQDFLYPIGLISGTFLEKEKYKALDSKAKSKFKEIIETKVLYNPNINLSLDEKSFLINSYIEASYLDNQYSKALLGHKEMIKILESDNIPDSVYEKIAISFYRIGGMQFDKGDFFNSIKNVEKAIEYNDIARPYLYENTKAFYLRTLFAAKWNFKENGEKMGACEDLRNAADLDPAYYDEYLQRCVN